MLEEVKFVRPRHQKINAASAKTSGPQEPFAFRGVERLKVHRRCVLDALDARHGLAAWRCQWAFGTLKRSTAAAIWVLLILPAGTWKPDPSTVW